MNAFEHHGAPDPFEAAAAAERAASSTPWADAAPPPARFERGPNGEVLFNVSSQDEPEWALVSSRIDVLALSHNGSGANWGHYLRIVDRDKREHLFAVRARLFHRNGGGEVIERLADAGAVIADRKNLIKFIQASSPDRRVLVAPKLGWTPGFKSFVLADGRTLGEGEAVYQPDTWSSLALSMRSWGDLDAWRKNVAALAVGNPLLVFGVSAALAGPLVELIGGDSFAVHLRGQSSLGKTSILQAAASVWGDRSFVSTWRATGNGIEGQAAAANGSVLILDELGQVSARDAEGVVYMIGNNRGKGRASGDGSARPVAEWRLIALSSGEIGLAEKLAENGKRPKAGELVRFLEIPATARKHGAFDETEGLAPAAFSDLIKDATTQFFGVAGPAFVERLVSDVGAARKAIRARMKEIEAKARNNFALGAQPEGQITRALKNFALIGAAGDLASRWSVTGWPEEEAARAALEAFGLWLEARGGAMRSETNEATRRVRDFLEVHRARFARIGEIGEDEFDQLGRRDDEDKFNQAGWRNADSFWINTPTWRDEIFKGADAQAAARELRTLGLLLGNSGEKLQSRLPNTVPGRPSAYRVSTRIFESHDPLKNCGDGGGGGDRHEIIEVFPSPPPPSTGDGGDGARGTFGNASPPSPVTECGGDGESVGITMTSPPSPRSPAKPESSSPARCRTAV